MRGASLRLQQVFTNLMGNSVKYTPDGGMLKLAVSEKSCDRPGRGCYEFVFEDNGMGMSEDYVQRIFEPFSRAEDQRVDKIQGTGLGMAITHSIVQMMEGDIQVESRLGKGSRFTVTVYLKLQENGAGDEGTNGTGMDSSGGDESLAGIESLDFSGRRALLVEDNELNREIAMTILETTGLAVEEAADGEEAVQQVSQHGDGYYDIIFMDVRMPRMNGYDATCAIRAMGLPYCKTVPIVAMTADAFAEDVRAAKNAGMNEHVSKPLNFKHLGMVMRKLLK